MDRQTGRQVGRQAGRHKQRQTLSRLKFKPVIFDPESSILNTFNCNQPGSRDTHHVSVLVHSHVKGVDAAVSLQVVFLDEVQVVLPHPASVTMATISNHNDTQEL